ncbi:MAG: hypothetical protein PHV16_01525 [Candidatus Nanoarchaeia archaeon]|nr:hypothetical protein [Candidatus Nanoarchaeia archaeon]
MKMRNEIVLIVLAIMFFGLVFKTATADPVGPNDIITENSEQGVIGGGPATEIEAEAGNVTQLTINASTLTNYWQGYYGNITGEIILSDASGNMMYDWTAGATGYTPVGEIYAANYSISNWGDVACVVLVGDGTPGSDGVNTTILEAMYGMDPNAGDGINETFTSTNDITIGTNTLVGCPATNTHVNNESQSTSFNETLLTENAVGTVIFATQVENDATGYDGNPWDFQMIVGENGDVEGTTTYYFYVELV